ncbi:hypothetical protein J2T14_003863 [Paenibacillus harenae]|nr:hypothetical protein [Paenibacillus harenae]
MKMTWFESPFYYIFKVTVKTFANTLPFALRG